MKEIVSQNEWHSMPQEEVTAYFKSSSNGLSEQEVKVRRRKSGPNTLDRQDKESAWKILLRQFLNPLIYILVAATVLAIVMGKITDGIVIIAVIFINAIIGFIQEYQAGNTIQGLLKLVPENVTVMRNGKQVLLPTSELVPGDYVMLQAGDRVSADIRLTFAKNAQCDEAMLTGESLPVQKSVQPVQPGASLSDRTCMVFSGTLMTSGAAEGVVVATGMATEIGKISSLLESTVAVKSPLTKSLEKIASAITYAIVGVGVVVFIIASIREYTFVDAALSAITLAVAAIPEGLPAVITIASAVGITRMAKRKAIIRHLNSVETLGSTTVICSDKTGTLTRNEMTVQVLWTGEQELLLSKAGPQDLGSDSKGETHDRNSILNELVRASVLCNDATIDHVKGDSPKSVGDPTEVALLVAAKKLGIQHDAVMNEYPRLDELPFDSDRKIMVTLHEVPGGGRVVYLKGAPESVVPMLIAKSDSARAIEPEAVRKKAMSFAETGMRVLAVGYRIFDNAENGIKEESFHQLEFLGLIAMSDPPRLEVKEAIEACHEAGIVVKMITGDHPSTAVAIGGELGLRNSQHVINGQELKRMDAQQLQVAVRDTQIFARVSPEDKLKLVEALQANGEVVAMTGDGVNDAPALKRADIGVAMGISGTAVAKESADMILANDNFESIEAAVEEGRRVFDNLLKSIIFLLPTSIGLGLVIFIAVLFFPSEDGILLRPMQPVQVLWINLITAVALTLPLALEAMEPDVMRRPPRRPGKPLLSRFMLIRIAIVALIMAGGTIGLFLWEFERELMRGTSHAIAVSEAQTMAVTAMVLFQIFYLMDCRSLKFSLGKIGLFSNPPIYLGIAVVLLAQAAFVYLPFMNRWFHSSPLKADAWGLSTVVALSILVLIAIEKWIRGRYFRDVEI